MIWFGLVSGAEIVQHASEILGRGVWSLEFGIRVWSLISVCFGKQLYFLVLELGV